MRRLLSEGVEGDEGEWGDFFKVIDEEEEALRRCPVRVPTSSGQSSSSERRRRVTDRPKMLLIMLMVVVVVVVITVGGEEEVVLVVLRLSVKLPIKWQYELATRTKVAVVAVTEPSSPSCPLSLVTRCRRSRSSSWSAADPATPPPPPPELEDSCSVMERRLRTTCFEFGSVLFSGSSGPSLGRAERRGLGISEEARFIEGAVWVMRGAEVVVVVVVMDLSNSKMIQKTK
ncbi:hypothetical protein TYRP_015344 [Tyrophagus putrescentiae]|nr:hypothetical protein TYRP_015344 [Tyrophagus putrescentiae]